MADEITTILSAVLGNSQSVGTIAAIFGIGKPIASKLLGPAAEEVGNILRDQVKEMRSKKTAETLDEVSKILDEAEVEPQPVPHKVLLPLLDAAGLEDDDFLRKTWAFLLANAANPKFQGKVDYGFVEILKQLSPTHILILTSLLTYVNKVGKLPLTESVMPTTQLKSALVGQVEEAELRVAIDTLARLRLCSAFGLEGIDSLAKRQKSTDGDRIGGLNAASYLLAPGTANISLTNLGIAFVESCSSSIALVQK